MRSRLVLKGEKLRWSQTFGSSGKEKPSKSFQKKQSWYEMTMQDAQKKEAS
jgi:hypothetical protein